MESFVLVKTIKDVLVLSFTTNEIEVCLCNKCTYLYLFDIIAIEAKRASSKYIIQWLI